MTDAACPPGFAAASLWRRALHWYAGRLPMRVILAEPDDDLTAPPANWTPLFERYFVGQWFGVTVYLHHYLRSDPDRGLHDHPWGRACALPVAGGYVEERVDGLVADGLRRVRRMRRPGLPYFLTGTDLHRVVVPAPGATSWSLFFHTPYCKGWGFARDYDAQVEEDRPEVLISEPRRVVDYTPHKESDSGESKWWKTKPLGRFQTRAAP